MFRQLTVFLLFIVFANAETSQQRWSYDEYLKELAQLQQRFKLPKNISKEEPSINSLQGRDSSVSPNKSTEGIQKEHIFSEQTTPLTNSGKDLEKELDTKVQSSARIQLPDEDPPFGNFSDANDTEYSIFCDDDLPKMRTHLPAVSKLVMALSRESQQELERDISTNISTEHNLEGDVSTKIEPSSTTEVSSTEKPSLDRNKEQVSDKDSHKPEEIAINQKEPSRNLLGQGPAINSNTSQDESSTRRLIEMTNDTMQTMKDDSTARRLTETANNTVQSMRNDSAAKQLMETSNNTVQSMKDDSSAGRLMETANNTVQSMKNDSAAKQLMETANNTVQSTKDDPTARRLTETANNTVQSINNDSTAKILKETMNNTVQSIKDDSNSKILMEIMNNTEQAMNEIQFEFQQDDEYQKVISRGDSAEDLELFNNTEELDFHCPTEFGFFPDINGNCSVFYSCHNGKAEKRVCAEGKLHFNPITRVCDHPAQALCELECPQVNGRFPVPGYCDMFLECVIGQGKISTCPPGLHFNAITKLCDKPSKVACEVSCPSYYSLLALPGRCNMYVRCENGEATYNLCPTGLHFNPLTLKCDWPDKAGCDIQCPSPDGYFPVLGQCSTYLLCRDNYPKIETCPSGLHFNFLLRTCDVPSKAGCELKCKDRNGFFPFPGVCSHYIKCIGGVPSLHKCPEELEFNTVTMQCDITKKDHCRTRCPTDQGIFPVPNHCDLYVRCSNRQPIVKRCPSNLHFNALFKECDTPERAKCQPVCPSPSGLFPLPGKCNMFFRCDNYKPTVQSCAHGLHFNPITLTCDWPSSVHCEMACPDLDAFYPVQGECNAYVMCSNGHPLLKTCFDDKHFNFETNRCDLPKNAKCNPRCLIDGKFPLAGHCDSYVYCQDGKPYRDSCPPGLLFNQVKKMCDLPENVSCSPGLL